MSFNTTNARIKEIRRIFCDGKNIVFAEKMRRNPNTVSNWVRDGYNVGKGVAKEIADTFNVNLGWLLTGEGEMLKTPKNDFSQLTNTEISGISTAATFAMLNRAYEKGEIYPSEVVSRMISEKDAKIEELQKRVWELERENQELKNAVK